MTEHERLDEHLRILRSLVERLAIYRALSATVALLGGLASLGISVWMLHRTGFIGSGDGEEAMNAREFIMPWLVPLFLTVVSAVFLLWRDARGEQRSLHSSGLIFALRSVLPEALLAAAVAYVAWRNPSDLDGPIVLALTWTSCYGVALLATTHFAPRALSMLGWSFVLTAVIWLLIISAPTLPEIDLLHGQTGANLLMGLTFGVYHLLYAFGIWTTRA